MARPLASALDPELGQRVGSSVVLATIALVAAVLGGWAFVALMTIAVVVMAREWARLAPGDRSGGWLSALTTAALPLAAVLLAAVGEPAWGAVTLGLGALGLAALALAQPGWRTLRIAAGVIYLGIPALALVWLRGESPDGMRNLLWLLVVVWATDVCAYLVGRSLGGPKLAPRVSPGKTWSGLLGGVAGASALGGLAALVLGVGGWLAAVLGGALAVVGQAGDLFESALKRRAGVKDSGRLIPGHGGLLDRIDGLLFAAPAFAGLVWLGLDLGAVR